MKRVVPWCVLMLIVPLFAADKQKDEDTFRKAKVVLEDMLNSKDISPALLSKADCVLILPGVKKFGVGVAASGGRGPMLCHSGEDFSGHWSTPAMISLSGGSVGPQVGGTSSDFVLLLMNPKVAKQILNGETKMGANATAAAGPGATAATPDADILVYGRAKGVFAGVSLGGATLAPDNNANNRLYGKTYTATYVARGTDVPPTEEGKALVTVLDSKIAKQ